jgi:hypothetical protein
MVLCSSCDGVPLKFKKINRPGLQYTSTDYLSIVLTPVRICWTIPFNTGRGNQCCGLDRRARKSHSGGVRRHIHMIIALDCKQIEDTLQLCFSHDTSAPQHQPQFKNVLRSCQVRRLSPSFLSKRFSLEQSSCPLPLPLPDTGYWRKSLVQQPVCRAD